VTGYGHPLYAAAFHEWGVPRELQAAGGWVLERDVAGCNARDAMGCYPMFACARWGSLSRDLDEVGTGWVSLTLVTDPFAEVTESELQRIFPFAMRQYKEHFVVELGREPAEFVRPHHLQQASKALKVVGVEHGPPTPRLLREWTALYDGLIARYSIRGLAAFSATSFEYQFRVPGLVVQWAECGGQVVGMALWYVEGNRAYYHLAASSDAGYAAMSSFALMLRAIEDFTAAGLRWLVLGAGAGAANDGSDGLTWFKRGWATGTRPTYLCGRVFDPGRYQALCERRGVPDNGYFPAYRVGEFR